MRIRSTFPPSSLFTNSFIIFMTQASGLPCQRTGMKGCAQDFTDELAGLRAVWLEAATRLDSSI